MRIGTDIVKISRMERHINDERFLKAVFAEEELEQMAKPYSAQSLAARFAAKEAVIKAIGKGVKLPEIVILKEELGRPYIIIKGGAKATASAAGCDIFDVSLAHEDEYALAFVIAENIETKGEQNAFN